MRLSLCTITFRHHLLSLEDIARWAAANGFQGIELWAAHARNMQHLTDRDAAWMAGFGLSVPMLSDYLPLDDDLATLRHATADLCRLANRWGAKKVRTFAGKAGSRDTSPEARWRLSARLKDACRIAEDKGCKILVETHPGTLADTLASTQRLIEEVDHAALAVNFDTLHVWEGGDDPLDAHRALLPHIRHYHLKNVRSRADLGVFEPSNVYAAAGKRIGMTPLFDGALNYLKFLDELFERDDVDASLEWFGGDCFNVLANDARNLRLLRADREAPVRAGAA
ncbi:sugar phosphate isomerase/epimerase [Mesorhizobium sp. LHD-90]|uniref:sugar phosphate isomerase/epimerase family protein n=1 Tax=Mesorhizobium sp. LHD-90 TaxID=3071414 RepID=UPI0027E198E1|nr:sugar phosphate isomerase/epimerase [Mesorhizobium sp. LHD-90]MDQ6433884.1 sugar phosphate isomerase/epimerase [Mesorhizobium sp. LHD-90]